MRYALYNFIAYILFFAPFVLTVVLYLLVREWPKNRQGAVMIIGGWVLLTGCTVGLNMFAVDFAPDAALREEAMHSDGASRLFAFIIGPIFGWIAWKVLYFVDAIITSR